MVYTQIEIENDFDGRLQRVYLNQPDTFNSLNQTLLKELQHFIKACDNDDNVRCIAISGRGKAFCSGQNLKEVLSLEEDIKENRTVQRLVIDSYNPLVKLIVNSEKPVVALVNGPAVGAGAMLALICDFALAKESAYFSQAFNNIGLIPDTGGTFYLPKLLGRQMASYLTFTGKKLSAHEAKNLGLIAEVFPDEDFEKETMAILTTLTHSATKAIGLTKKAFNKSYHHSLKEQLDVESIYQQEAAESDDFKEGVQAFLEKRQPKYTGK